MASTRPARPSAEIEPLVLVDVRAWRAWLDAHEDASDGVWLLLAKQGTVAPTSLSYAEALDEALCSGWIDGQTKSVDAGTYLRRFTPRRARSLWSARNVEHVARLTDDGRMRPRGLAEVERAQADGRWESAYAGSASMTMPDDLAAALASSDAARAAFEALNAQNRYSVLHRVTTARTPELRLRRIERVIAMLAGGDTPHPQ
ncbi:YdeI/OmpD-associated family protein [Leucobacter allii]|uniref:YdeI/OmpD-associated family protein n=1 Tax=Leucobacter allii TaxID=2932247 RepID=UPI001FD35C84|nr:YdeI/OmpD-associated family protein [Leucobacter allii]UOR00681.1 YdeI/OmpD-associated family protein [Leucobacter allii]